MTTVVNKKTDPYDIYIGRPSKWGNPFSHRKSKHDVIIVDSAEMAVNMYYDWVVEQPDLMEQLGELRGKVLGCWCKPGLCHGDVLAWLADWVEVYA